MKKVDCTGQKFGRLTAKRSAGSNSRGEATWLCVCECGNPLVVASGDLRYGHTQSCGCLQKERASKAVTTHGMSRSRVYVTWCHMRERCSNPAAVQYKHYGGRGIRVCERWNDFAAFYADMGERPPKHSIDRIDPNGDYTPENCRWATTKQQQENKRKGGAV